MNKVLVGLILSFLLLLPVFASAEVAEISRLGEYPKHGDGFLYLADGGYAELTDSNVTDIDYMTTGFSVEAIVDVRSYTTYGTWTVILSKLEERIYQDFAAGWALGLTSPPGFEQNQYQIIAKVGDGTQHAYLTHSTNGVVHLAMTWDVDTRTVELFVDGEFAGNDSDSNISLAGIDTSEPLQIGMNYGELRRNVLMARWWGKKLSSADITSLSDNWLDNGDDRVPAGVSTSNLISEWLMNDECSQEGGTGTGYLKDSFGINHLQLFGNASIITSEGESLTLLYPADGETNVHKSITLKADGGDSDILGGEVTNPLLYFFQVDTSETFDSPNLRESGWIPGYPEWMPVLDVDTTYYWRVKVKDQDGDESQYSEVRSFTTEPASYWYVRPAGGNYGTEDGTSYENAWDGLRDIVFGETGVEPGDTLYICGTHVFNRTQSGYFTAQDDIVIKTGANDDAPYWIEIRGDCPVEQGIVWGAYKRSFGEPWVDEGGGVWSSAIHGSSPSDWYFQDIGVPNDDSYVLLDPVLSLEELRAHPGGAQYSDNYGGGGPIYVKLTDGGDPKDRFYFAEFGYEFQMSEAQYIKFQNLKLYVPKFYWGGYWSSVGIGHVIWDNCTFWYDLNFYFGNYCHHIEVRNSDIAWGVGGLGITENPHGINLSLNHYIFSGNKIHDIGVRPSTQNSDAHGIGANGGRNGIIEKNEFYNCGSGITFYAYDPESILNNTIRWNWFHDMHTLGGANDVGIEFNCGAWGRDTSGNKIYGNIVGPGVDGIGYKTKYKYETEFFNNVCYECGISFWLYNHMQGVRAEVKNCISLYPTQRHIYYGGNEPEGDYHIDSDYNIFYPVSGDQFHFRDASGHKDINFSEWQSLARVDCTFDPHSFALDPLFLNPVNNNFRLHRDSPAIDNGTNVGLTIDYDGNPLPQGDGFDIGAFGYLSGFTLLGDLNGDGYVDIFDLILISYHFGRGRTDLNWNESINTVPNDEIDIFDVVFVGSRFT